MFKKKHGNDKSSPKKQHLYEIKDDDLPEGLDTHKYGVSGQDLNKNGTSRRVNSQKNLLNKETGYDKYSAHVLQSGIDGRESALNLEYQHVENYNKHFGVNPPGNIRPKITKKG